MSITDLPSVIYCLVLCAKFNYITVVPGSFQRIMKKKLI
uniref:Uncharacterized protein n=1 Tax=Anguilla anguilla TaxID=7936 RepID=A0A0E9T030_ANGAN